MKKALMVLLALVVVGGAFAEVSVGGSIVGLLKPQGSDAEDSDVTLGWTPNNGQLTDTIRPRVNVTATNEDGTFGGWIQLRQGRPVEHSLSFLANAWWKPIEQLTLTYGYLWGDYNPIGVVLVDDDIFGIPFSGRSANYIPWGYEVLSGVHLNLNLLDNNLYILASVPLDNWGNLSYNGWNTPYYASNATAGAILAHTMARIGYNIDGIGKVRFTFSGGSGNMDGIDLTTLPIRTSTDTVTLDLGFGLTAIENLALDFGFQYKLASSKLDDATATGFTGKADGEGTDAKVKYQDPMAINVRANFTSGDFGIAGGVAVGLGGSITPDDGDAYSMPLTLGVTINPQYNLGIVTAGVVADIGFTAADKYEAGKTTLWDVDSVTAWKFIPYLTKDVGGAGVHLGFEISGSTAKDSPINWAVPIGFTYYF